MPEVVTDKHTLELLQSPAWSRVRKYDWEQWADGVPRLFKKDVDYKTSTATFIGTARCAASRMNATLIVRKLPEGVLLQMTPNT